MKPIKDIMWVAKNLRKDVDRYKSEIESHVLFAEKNPQYELQILKDLEAGRKDINQAIWILNETRTAMICKK